MMDEPKTMPIAIIGMSCRLAGDATSPQKLWQLVSEARSGWSEIPKDRFNGKALYHPLPEKISTNHVRGAHFMTEDIGLFDASFFNFSVEVAATMDPQIRLQLESAFEALENAGIPIEKIAGSNTSVFGGEFVKDYHDSLMRDPETLPRFQMTGNGVAMMSARVSHFFDLRGPCLTVDTGCSTSLAALHLACQSIQSGDSKISIVGGANVLLNPDMFNQMSAHGLLSKEGRSFSFDSRGTGYGRGEGVTTIVVKALEDALRDNDPVRAVIRGTALNQDGKTPTITSPSQQAQEELMRLCYQRAGLNPLDTAYVEAHGTGTRTGDPIEASAIHSIFGGERPGNRPLLVGSVKSNIGHCEAASGLAGVIKVVMALEKGLVPPNYDFETPNQNIPFKEFNMKVPTSLEQWPKDMLRRASVNSFGYGGTNAHAIIDGPEMYIRQSKSTLTEEILDRWRIFKLSGKDEGTTKKMISQLREHLMSSEEDEKKLLWELAYTLGQRRSTFAWSIAITARTKKDLIEALEPANATPVKSDGKPRLGFVFTGQGAQWHAMGRELIAAYPVFRDSVYEADRCLKELGGTWSVIEELAKEAETSRVNEPVISLPVCAVIQLSLVRLLRSWGIDPTAVTGHSSGEVGAAFAANAINFEEALAIVYSRGSLTEAFQKKVQRKGGMIAVGLGREDVKPYLTDLLSGTAVIACVNSPTSVTVSGDLPAIAELEARLKPTSIFARRLKVDAAYHSNHMEPLAEDYMAFLQQKLSNKGDFKNVIFSSPTTGTRVAMAQDLDPEHWVRNMVQPVLFVDSFTNMCIDTSLPFSDKARKSIDIVVEIGPHGALAGPIRQTLQLPELKGTGILYGSCLVRGQDAVMTTQNLASFLISRGYPVNLEAVNFTSDAAQPSTLCNLPSYPWNHQTRYWAEPRLNRQHRLREHPGHDLLGVRAVGTNPNRPTWRHIIRAAEIPWVRDHLIQSTILYPGAGYICMAIEGICQLFETEERPITGYKLRDIDIVKALIVPDTAHGIEAQLQLRSCSDDKMLGSDEWYEFQVYSVSSSDEWTEHCRGYISITMSTGESEKQMVDKLSKISFVNKKDVDPREIYNSLHGLGIQHGPAFQNLTAIQTDDGQSVSTFRITDTASLMPEGYEHKHILHPTTLDSIFQAVYTALPEAGLQQTSAMVPRNIKKMFVRADIPNTPATLLQAYSSIVRLYSRGFSSSIITTAQSGSVIVPFLEVSDLYCHSLGDAVSADKGEENTNLCSTLTWDRDLAHIQPEELNELVGLTEAAEDIKALSDLKCAALYFIRLALENLHDIDISGLDGHNRRFYNWMVQQNRLASFNELEAESLDWLRASDEDQKKLVNSVRSSTVNGEMLCRIGEKIVPILRKEITPLEVMLEKDLLYTYDEQGLRVQRSHAQVQKLIRFYAHKNPRANILELGAGVGGCTQVILQALGGGNTRSKPLFSHYDFTDISPGFFGKARERFSAWGDLIGYKTLDLELDSAEQSFESASYDLIIACRVLHATKLMTKTMAHVRKLLKPNGTLIIIEDTDDALDTQVINGVLPGWWLGEEEDRKQSPTLPINSWESILKQTGFNGLDLELRDFEEEPYHCLSVMMATARPNFPASYDPEIVVVYQASKPPVSWASSLEQSITNATGSNLTVAPLASADVSGKVCIFLEVERPELVEPTTEQYKHLQKMLLGSKATLWVTRGGAIDCEQPMYALSHGLLRTLRCEASTKRYITLDLDSARELWTLNDVAAITNIYKGTFDFAQDQTAFDFEYAERKGTIQIPRLFESPEVDAIVTEPVDPIPEMQPFDQPGRELRLEVLKAGTMDGLAFCDVPTSTEELPEDFVEIQPHAFGLNFRDVMVAMGQLDETRMGYEAAGYVTRVGREVTNLTVGDRICAQIRGHYANRVRLHYTSVCRIPDEMSFEIAATVPMVFITAYAGLYDFARLQKGETVLIHAGTGGVGQAAIILAQLAGAEIIATAGAPEKREFLTQTYGIPSDHIFSSRDSSFVTGIMNLTKGKGVDVVLNSLAGQLLCETWNCIARFGRFCEIGKRDIIANHGLEMGPFQRMVSFASVDLIQIGEHKGKDLERILTDVLRLMKAKSIRPISPITTFSISDIERAFRSMQAGKHMGKIVIKPNTGDLVKVLPRKRSVQLSSDASYLIVGGMGGIGQSICRRLVQRGAKSLVLLSRSAEKQIKASQKFLLELATAGCRVSVRSCDVTSKTDLARVVAECERELPPIQGVIQAAMILKDTVFEQMSCADYTAAVGPKVLGTWNLHEQFASSPLDFFIVLSSLVGVAGNGGQANYAAGGSFEDAVARYRTTRGLPAVTIDLGAVKQIGYLVDHVYVADRLAKMGFKALGEKQVLDLVEAGIKDPLRSQNTSQIVTGISIGSSEEWAQAPWRHDPRFAGLKAVASSSAAGVSAKHGIDLKAQLKGAGNMAEAVEFVCAAISHKISEMFSVPEDEVDPAAPMSRYGIDSLVAIELRNWLASSTQAETSIFDVTQSPSLIALAEKVAAKSALLTGLTKQ